ncbi:MAG TPA: RdgB/HAM1 family non-canonical purine NTP pyrophosphatase [Candidatus Aquilonibacter sp.]|nr:RdgB/HAM1 family non-canonical purine NTP pyrophosphatase [Candidatus Aquilonibacter sp.]
MTIYAATKNQGKLKEFRECAGRQGVEVLALPGIEGMPEPVEDAATFMENAELKAVAYSKLALAEGQKGLMVFADDSGLEVDALDGQPGVRSARFADDLGFEVGQGTKDERNNRAVMSLLQNLPEMLEADGGLTLDNRGARFVCVLVLARDGAVVLRAGGEVEGEILDSPRGVDGFGYDPLFLVPELGKTLAEVSAEEKWRVSHRGNAFRELLRQLKNFEQSAR